MFELLNDILLTTSLPFIQTSTSTVIPHPFPKAISGDELESGLRPMRSWKAEFKLLYMYIPAASARTTQLGWVVSTSL